MVNILICGACGKMGRVIAECVKSRNDAQIVAGVDINNVKYDNFPIYKTLSDVNEDIDVIIDFSHPALLNDLLDYAVSKKIPLVAATTGYNQEQIQQIKDASEKTAVFFTFNMSLGVNLMLDLSKRAAKILSGQFDIEIVEKHHNQKIDAPSGTAIMLANAINEACDDKYNYSYDRHSKRQKRDASEIGIHSIRGGSIVGEHEVIFAGLDEVLSIKHQATSKEVFAVGAVNAAIYLHKKCTGLYDMSQLLSEK